VAIFAISCLTALGFIGAVDVAGSIATVALAVAAANAAQKSFAKRDIPPGPDDYTGE